nr:hypothetical protein [Tanacetum cinerariifolium]
MDPTYAANTHSETMRSTKHKPENWAVALGMLGLLGNDGGGCGGDVGRGEMAEKMGEVELQVMAGKKEVNSAYLNVGGRQGVLFGFLQ